MVGGTPRGAPAVGLRDHRIGPFALRLQRAEAGPKTEATALVVRFLTARDRRLIPSGQDSRGALIAAVALVNGNKGKPDPEDRKGHDPGTHELTQQIGRAPRRALSGAVPQHDAQLQLVLWGSGEAQSSHAGSLGGYSELLHNSVYPPDLLEGHTPGV